MGTLWVEKQRGRIQALGTLEASRPALALAEPASPGESAGQPLASASRPSTTAPRPPMCCGCCATWPATPRSLPRSAPTIPPRTRIAAANHGSGRSQFERLLEQAGARRDLSWFFADWVDADKGLPDLSIAGRLSHPCRGRQLAGGRQCGQRRLRRRRSSRHRALRLKHSHPAGSGPRPRQGYPSASSSRASRPRCR